MDELRILEYDKIIQKVSGQTVSALGKTAALELMPEPEPEVVRERLLETKQAVFALGKKGTLPIGDFGDIKDSAVYAKKGGVLTMAQLLAVALQLEIVGKVTGYLKSDITEANLLVNIGQTLARDKSLEDRIRFSILSDTEMADNASPELKRIRRGIVMQNESIRAQLNKMITSSSYEEILREQIITQRDGRWAVPVKQEHVNRVAGTHLGRSKGGATVFIEPQAVTGANNKLRELEAAEKDEIDRILAEMSVQVGDFAHALILNQELLISLDLIFAKGRLAEEMEAVCPEIGSGFMLEIEEGRHPLIDPEKVVPISLKVGEDDMRALIITGPNTGGKTVTLKTAGLFVLMCEAGLFLPASRVKMPLFKKVYADIGDEQSIEQSLSTFSSHMQNIVNITDTAGSDSIVLLDELGAGTDPTEGAALAISILEYLRERGALVLATTHYTELKKYAMVDETVENASMEFDVKTLRPTYKLRLGIPGSSNAFEISRRLGLSGSIVDRAADHMDSGSIAFESVLEEAERSRKEATKGLEEADIIRAELESEQEIFDKKQREFNEKKEKILEKAREEAEEKINEAEEYAEIIKAELKALVDDAESGDFYRRLDENKKQLKSIKEEYKKEAPEKNKEAKKQRQNKKISGKKPEKLTVGDDVYVMSLDQDAEVVTAPDERGEVQVQLGRMRMSLPVSDLRIIECGGKNKIGAGGKYESTGRTGIVRDKLYAVKNTLDVHGQNLDDAIMNVDKYIDDAYLAGLGEVSIIHGLGEGILKNGLRKMLRSNKHVKTCHKGSPFEGGDGVTIVELKK